MALTRGEILPGCDSIGPLQRQRRVISLVVLRNQVHEGAGVGQTAHERASAGRVADEVRVASERGGERAWGGWLTRGWWLTSGGGALPSHVYSFADPENVTVRLLERVRVTNREHTSGRHGAP